MTGKPEYTFRESDEMPQCRKCGEEMEFIEHQEGPFNERDLYKCPDCGARLVDRWTF